MYILKRIGNGGGYLTKSKFRDTYSKLISPEVTKVFLTIEEVTREAKDDEVPVYIDRLI
jgi:hypothetical protein